MKKKQKYQFGGNLPGATGLMYARTGSTSSNGKKTKPFAQDGTKVAYSNPTITDLLLKDLTKKTGLRIQHSDEHLGDSTLKYGDKYAGYDFIDLDPKIPLNKYPKRLQNIAATEGFSPDFPNRHIIKHYVKEENNTYKSPILMDKPFYESYKDVPQKTKGGIIEDNMGQYNHPGKVTKIKSNQITMKNIPYPILGVSDTGHKQLMQPEGEYSFNGSSVTEYPMTAKSGIHIKPSHKGLLHKNLGVKKGEKIPASKLAIKSTDSEAVRKRKQFAINAKKWHHGQDGLTALQQYTSNPVEESILEMTQKGPNSNLNGLNTLDQSAGILDKIGGINGVLNTGSSLISGFGQLKQDKLQKQQMHQFADLSKVVLDASSIRPDRPKRKYVRPEDVNFDPNELSKSYGTGTNFLAKNGKKVKKAQFGMKAGSLGTAAGSKLFGGTGQQSGAGMIGSTIGSTAGKIFGPLGETIGGALGGFVGGAIGAKGQKQTKQWENAGFANLQNAAFQEAIANTQNQYSGFMRTGGHLRENIMAMGGELKTHWGGEAEPVSENRFLPDGGQSVLFKGKSHDEGGIGVTFGKSPVEVEGGEPAVKLQDGGTGDNNLVVFGNMKIPSYGVSEIGDENAKGKKFKTYINDLNKIEARQNNVVEKGVNLVNDTPTTNAYDRLKFNSGEAMMTGGNMKLKDIAQKKQMTSIIQNAILETADEQGLESDALAKGNIKKAKFGAKLTSYQDGGIPKSIKSSEKETYLKYGWMEDLPNNRLYKDFMTPGETNTVNNGVFKPGSPEFDKAFGQARKAGLTEFEWKGKKYGTEMYKPTKTVTSTPDIKDTKYIPIQDDYLVPPDSPVNSGTPPQEASTMAPPGKGPGWENYLNAYLPYLRPSNQLKLDPNQLSGEMFSLASNQLEPVQSQLYRPLLENVSDISLQDQMNANQSDFNSIQRQVGNNPAALSNLAAQKYAANSGVLGEQFRQNQNQRMGVYNRNRGVLNDATLKNLGILDEQYVRQSKAKSNTKAQTQTALNSISDKIAKNKLENKTLGIYENLYNYRFGPNGRAWNLNGPAQFDTDVNPQELQTVDINGNIIQTSENSVTRDRYGNVKTRRETDRTTTSKKAKKSTNGSIIKALKNY